MIYADYNATTPCLPEVVAVVSAWLARPGNPSARNHLPGREALGALDAARAEVAALIGARPEEIIFTSGATEACNLAILGVAERLLTSKPGFVALASEHHAVLAPHQRLGAAAAEVRLVPIDSQGLAVLEALDAAVDTRTALVSSMLVNNETGVIQDVPTIARLAHARGALVLCDATQATARMRVDVAALGADFVALSAHKAYGPPGVGALWVRRGLAIEPQIHGGGQERGLRSGTHNLPGIIGFGVAARIARSAMDARIAHLTVLTARLEAGIRAQIPDVVVQGDRAPRAPGTSMFTIPGLPRGWLAQLSDVAASGGSSCASASGLPSHVLAAMGVAASDAGNSVRISLGAPSTAADVDAIIAALTAGAQRLRSS
ncbi:MAG: cysteine desulfurase [Planctomycetes bacterium]|nr:cysteine desulfurase [Planctomycetota bacterium]